MEYHVEPWSHQRATIEKCEDRNYHGLFFEMGCGKTATAINILRQKCNAEKRILNTLILCPLIVKENWAREISIHAPNLEPFTTVLKGIGVNRIKQFSEAPAGLVVTNIETINMAQLWANINSRPWDMVIVDESHKFKNPLAKRTKKFLTFLRDVRPKYRLILTGTPVLNSPMDLWSQVNILSSKIFNPNFYAWRAEYFYDRNAGRVMQNYFPDWKPQKDAAPRLNAIVQKHATRVTKDEVLDLPPLVRQRVHLSLIHI